MVEVAQSIDLKLSEKLKDRGYRAKFFLAEASALIAKQLIALRKKRALNQTDLAKEIGTKQPAISRVESADYQNWSFSTLRSIADVLDARIRVTIEPAEDILREYEESKEIAPEQSDLLNTYKTIIEDMSAYFTGPNTSYSPPLNHGLTLVHPEVDQSGLMILGQSSMLSAYRTGTVWTNNITTTPINYLSSLAPNNSANKFGARSRLFKFLLRLIDNLTGRIAALEAENIRLKDELELRGDASAMEDLSKHLVAQASVAQKAHWGRP